MMKAIAVLLSLALLATGAQAQTAKEKYELSTQCGRQAAETFRKYWGSGIFETDIAQIIVKYENHYKLPLDHALLFGNQRQLRTWLVSF